MATEKPTVKVTQEMLLVEENTMIGSIILSTARQLQLRPVRLVTSCKRCSNGLGVKRHLSRFGSKHVKAGNRELHTR
jgi:hypothetical protein